MSADRTGCQRWWLASATSESCDTVCAAAGHACAGGDWGIGDRASLEAALAEAGQSSGDRASLCSGGYAGGGSSDQRPYVQPDHNVGYWQVPATTTCPSTYHAIRRLCRCV